MKDAETSASPEATIAVFGRGKLGGFDDQSIRKAKSNSGLIQRLLQGTEQDKARAHELIQLQEKRAKKNRLGRCAMEGKAIGSHETQRLENPQGRL